MLRTLLSFGCGQGFSFHGQAFCLRVGGSCSVSNGQAEAVRLLNYSPASKATKSIPGYNSPIILNPKP